MRIRSFLPTLLLTCLVVPFSACNLSSPSLTSIAVTPNKATGNAGITVQFTATGSYTHPGHPAETKDLTSQVTWTSASTQMVTISKTGFATVTGLSAGNTTISASMPGFNGIITGSADFTVTASSSGGGGGGGGGGTGDVTSLSIIPSTQSVNAPNQTAQFIAIGTTSTGATESLTNQVVWSSSSVQVGIINAAGLATGIGKGTTTITAIFTNADGTVATGTATFTVVGGTSQSFTAITVTPDAESLSASGQTGQFIALGTSGSTGLIKDVTDSPLVKWSSSVPSIATVSSTGLAQGVSVGTSTITAELTNADGSVVTASASVTVTLTAAPEPLLSLTIIPSAISVGNLQATGQFLAIGTFSTAPTVRDVTNTVTWLSSTPNTFPVSTNNSGSQGRSNAGVASAFGTGSAVIIAEATATDGSVQTATATFSCPLALPDPTTHPPTPGSCFPGSEATALLSTLTVYNEGLNTTNWEITAPSATGTPNVIHCGPGWALGGGTGGSVCTATFPADTNGLPTQVTVTSPAGAGAFGGWSTNCTATTPVTAAGPNSCTVTLTSDETVGAIIN